MSVVRIDIPASHTHGWQARHTTNGRKGKRLTAFFADSAYGGSRNALKHATWAAARLRARARTGI